MDMNLRFGFAFHTLLVTSLLVATPELFSKEKEGKVSSEPRSLLNLNQGWGFYRGDLPGAEKPDFDDKDFAAVSIPHSMRLERKHCGDAKNVFQGIGWYRRPFVMDARYKGQRVHLDFEGIMINSDVYLNGEKLHTRNGGYMGFSVDITDKVQWDKPNVLAIRVSNEDDVTTPPGKPLANLDFLYYGGIYRDVALRITPQTHITDALQANKVASGGVFVTYPEVSEKQATIKVQTHMAASAESGEYTLKNRLINHKGKVVAEKTTPPVRMEKGKDSELSQELTVKQPQLWNPDSPYLYTLSSEIYQGDRLIDRVDTKAGIRTIAYKPDGFYINGKHFFIRGANRHQSYPYVGDAAPNSMQRRDALQLKKNGFNAVRATHYPQDSAFLDACDELGILVLECQPGWQFFGEKEFHARTMRDAQEMIRRDRNRPSVIMWETALNETGYSEDWAKEVTTKAHAEYPGDQLFTSCDYGRYGKLYDVCYKVVDKPVDGEAKDFDPQKPFFTREWGDWGHQSLRGEGEAQMLDQVRAREDQLNGRGYPDWGGLDACERTGGYFLWSWNDYPRGSQIKTLGSGAIDSDRYEKYSAYWLETMQPARDKQYGPKVFISGTNSANSAKDLMVFSNCDSVRLYRNGKLLEEKTRESEGKKVPFIMKRGGSPVFHFSLSEFVPGSLKAEGILDGKVVVTHEIKTPEAPQKLELEIRDRGIAPVADGSDLIPVHFLVKDKNGTLIPDYKGTVTVKVTGEGELVGKDIPRIEVEKPEGGIGFAFIRTTNKPGKINITVSANDLAPATATIRTVPTKEKFVPVTSSPWTKTEKDLESSEKSLLNTEEKLPGKIISNSAVKSITTSEPAEADRGTDKLRDGNTLIGTGWLSTTAQCPQTVTLEFKNPTTVKGSRIHWEKDSSQYCYDLEVSTDGTHWKKVLDQRKVAGQFYKPEPFPKEEKNIRYVRLTFTSVSSGAGVDKLGMAEWVLYE